MSIRPGPTPIIVRPPVTVRPNALIADRTPVEPDATIASLPELVGLIDAWRS